MNSKDNKQSTIVSKIIKYLNKYDKVMESSIFIDEEIKRYMIVLKHSIILYNEKTKNLEVSFNIATRPVMVGNYVLLFQGSPGIKKVEMFESYFWNEKGDMVWGEDAFNEFKRSCVVCQENNWEVINERAI